VLLIHLIKTVFLNQRNRPEDGRITAETCCDHMTKVYQYNWSAFVGR